ncbi:phosphotransferase [Baekduia soli]|uniref:Phosphotransferase n=1 Tax=Baekduia soli TaxID=496014 RepID=A0A5B8U4L7_9ACTN|nr:phosphotransferase [Baekduia soli]QEC48056.1 phosphotransferase [Baekduia soli]
MRPPPEVIEAVQARLGALREGPAPLGGGITNHNWRARFGDTHVVLRIAGRQTDLLGIDRAAERQATEAAAGLGVAPEVLAYLPAQACLVTRFVPGTPVREGAVAEPGCLRSIARSLRAFHDHAPTLPVRFDVPSQAQDYLAIAAEHGGDVPEAAHEAAAVAARVAAALSGPEHDPVPCHDDLLAANLLRDGDRLWIVDWEYAGMGDRYFDLGNLSVNNGLDEDDDVRLLEAYWNRPCTPRRFAALRLMRAMSDVREGLWGVVQGAISDLDVDFGAYAEQHLGRLRTAVDDPRFERWMHDAASP